MLVTIILILVFLGIVGNGWKDGVIQVLGRIVGSVLGFLLARMFSITFAFLFQIFLPSGWARFAAFIVIFYFVTWVVGFVFKLADGAWKIISLIPFVKPISGFLGAIFGILEAIIVIGGAIWMLKNFALVPWLTDQLNASVVATGILFLFEKALTLVL